jgi:hypothetical protein
MLAVAAAVLFVLGFLFEATGTSVPAVLNPISLLLLGLACLALHQAGFGTATPWSGHSSSRRTYARRR